MATFQRRIMSGGVTVLTGRPGVSPGSENGLCVESTVKPWRFCGSGTESCFITQMPGAVGISEWHRLDVNPPLFLFAHFSFTNQQTGFDFWLVFFLSLIHLSDLLNLVVQTCAGSRHKGHFSPWVAHVPFTFSQIDAETSKFTKHLGRDWKNTRIWSSCFHLQKQSCRKTRGLSFNCCCWLAKRRGESKRQLTAALTARTKSHLLLLNPAVSTLFLLSLFFYCWF